MYLDIFFPDIMLCHGTVLDRVPPKPGSILEFLDSLVVLFKLPWVHTLAVCMYVRIQHAPFAIDS
jgi:hypothetical protein